MRVPEADVQITLALFFGFGEIAPSFVDRASSLLPSGW
jgi:hypothetical protein